MADLPSMDDILAKGRARERKVQLGLGLLLVGGGLAYKLGLASLTGTSNVVTFGAIGLGAALIGRSLFARS